MSVSFCMFPDLNPEQYISISFFSVALSESCTYEINVLILSTNSFHKKVTFMVVFLHFSIKYLCYFVNLNIIFSLIEIEWICFLA